HHHPRRQAVLPAGGVARRRDIVGWVERSETRHRTRNLGVSRWVSAFGLYPSYAPQSGRINPDTPSNAPGVNSATTSRSGSTGPGITARPFGTALKPARP